MTSEVQQRAIREAVDHGPILIWGAGAIGGTNCGAKGAIFCERLKRNRQRRFIELAGLDSISHR